MYVTRLPTTIYAFLMRYTLHIVFMTCKGGRRRQTQNGRNWGFHFLSVSSLTTSVLTKQVSYITFNITSRIPLLHLYA